MVAPATPGKAPLGIVKRDEEEFRQWLSTERGFLTAFGTYDDTTLKLESFQDAFLETDARYRCVEKSRQVGYSFIFSCEALARSHLRDTYNAIFCSYNLSDAKEKISYVQQMHEELPIEYQKKKITDSKLEIAFRSNSSSNRISRIISNPSRAPRGKKGDIYLDELAHCANDREIYKGSTALILRSKGQLTVCSSPLGRRGTFWEIARQELRPYRVYWRQRVPWWLCSQFCIDVQKAAREASDLSTAERVDRFGTKDIKDQCDSLPVEDFQQEFEVAYSDETLSFFPYEVIIPCTDPTLELAQDFASIKPRGRVTAGFDVGRERDLSVFSMFDHFDGIQRCLMIRKYKRVPFQVQEHDIRLALKTVPIARLSIDSSSLGMQLAENLSLDFPQVVRENFSQQSKETWCTDFKIALQRQEIRLPSDRDLITEIHSIKKKVTPQGKIVFDSERTRAGHADTFWSIVLACKQERGELREPATVGVTIIG